MKKIFYSFFALASSLWLTGCAYTREPMQVHDEYFAPLTSLPHRQASSYSSSDLEQLRHELAEARNATKELRDSLTAMTHYTGSMLTSARSMVEKISELESREYLTLTRQKQLEENVEKLKMENDKLGKEMSDLLASTNVQSPRALRPSSSEVADLTNVRAQYPHALVLFAQKKYDGAIQAFKSMLKNGVEEDLADNCIYWMGEGYFAKANYQTAIMEFQKVISIESSNKKADAYFMLGRSYEATGDLKKAQKAYEQVTVQFPQSANAFHARIHLQSLKSHFG